MFILCLKLYIWHLVPALLALESIFQHFSVSYNSIRVDQGPNFFYCRAHGHPDPSGSITDVRSKFGLGEGGIRCVYLETLPLLCSYVHYYSSWELGTCPYTYVYLTTFGYALMFVLQMIIL